MTPQETSQIKNHIPRELEEVKTILSPLGFSLDNHQPHIEGERFLMMKDKLVLLGKDSLGKPVVIKASKHKIGKEEIIHEQKIRQALLQINFSTSTLLVPEELYFGHENDYVVWITRFIPQGRVFATHHIKDQFFMMMRVFENQEAFHARTFEHFKKIKGVFSIWYAKDYIQTFSGFVKNINHHVQNPKIGALLTRAQQSFLAGQDIVQTYCDYLSHTDLAPTNFRVTPENDVYLIDLSSMAFGNKYDGWARFQNWGVLHDPELEKVIDEYLQKGRPDEYECFRLMKIYKIGFLLNFYANSLVKTTGNLHTLTMERINLWGDILEAVLSKTRISDDRLNTYRKIRDSLRTQEELARQKEFNNI